MTALRLALAAALLAAATPSVSAREDGAARFQRFFAGDTRSEGAFLDGAGRPTDRFSGRTEGSWQPDGSVRFDQAIRFTDGSTRRRDFRLGLAGDGRLLVTGSEVVGAALGTVSGDTLRLRSVIRSRPGNPLTDLDYEQVMTLSPDGRSLANRTVVSKFGLPLARLSERFARLRPARRRAAR